MFPFSHGLQNYTEYQIDSSAVVITRMFFVYYRVPLLRNELTSLTAKNINQPQIVLDVVCVTTFENMCVSLFFKYET